MGGSNPQPGSIVHDSILLSAVLACSLAACSPASPSTSAMQEEGTFKRPPSFFYRMKADFILKKTGEPISFDYVVGCGGVVFGNAGTTDTVFYEHHPMTMFKPVGDGHVIGLVTIDMCEDWKWQPIKFGERKGESRIPDNLRPLAIWFEDINDLSFGWGYKTDDAYESPLAKIEFVKASVTKTDEAAWREWRDSAAKTFEQIGALPGPWGYSYSHEAPEIQRRVASRGEGFGIASGDCLAESRIAVPDDVINSALDEVGAPSDRYYVSLENQGDLVRDISQQLEQVYGQKPLSAYLNSDFWFYGTLRRAGGGHISPYDPSVRSNGLAYRDIFPLLVRSKEMNADAIPADTYRRRIDTSEGRKGFSACISALHPMDTLHSIHPVLDAAQIDIPIDVSAKSKSHVFFVGDDLIGSDPRWAGQSPLIIFDREGNLYLPER
ncbi:hypothetical protein WNY37_07760 [Henriciella sp. AS95]|uniref:hypothetical protein n=1 Tax=Henriciella sp. AS95 TaxID=3135782 RepID=UPI00317624D2